MNDLNIRPTGPVTPEGKAISRQNSYKHGLTGQGTVLAEGAREEIDRRIAALTEEMKPMSTAGIFLIAQMATLSYRAERAGQQEAAMVAMNVRQATEAYDEEQWDKANTHFKALSEDLRTHRRKLSQFPAGVDRMVEAWIDLKADLNIRPLPVWTPAHLDQAGYLLGFQPQQVLGSRFGVLSKALWSDFSGLTPAEGGNLSDAARRGWALNALIQQIGVEIAALKKHRAGLDLGRFALDRAEAGDRALFDASKAATLARRYEAEARRSYFKALQEFRIVEAEALANANAAPQPQDPAEVESEPGSFRENPQASASTTDSPARPTKIPAVRDTETQTLTADRPPITPG